MPPICPAHMPCATPSSSTNTNTLPPPEQPLSHWLRLALVRFEARVWALMAHHPAVPLGLAHLAARGQVGAAHVHIARHLPPEGLRLTDLAQRAGMRKQAMAALVKQCEAWGMVARESHPSDARAQRLVLTAIGLAWRSAYLDACAQAQAELQAAISPEVATVVTLGLEAYCSQ